jgi:hypothetical protein
LSVAEASVRSAESDDEAGGGTVALPRCALDKREKVRESALGLPGVDEEFAPTSRASRNGWQSNVTRGDGPTIG